MSQDRFLVGCSGGKIRVYETEGSKPVTRDKLIGVYCTHVHICSIYLITGMDVRMYLCIYVRMYVYACMYVCKYVQYVSIYRCGCMYVSMYVFMHIRTYLCVWTDNLVPRKCILTKYSSTKSSMQTKILAPF